MPDARFFKLAPEKQRRILDAAMDEFVASGFQAASTNHIVKAAGIAKGSLFNYFSSKDDIWLYLAEITLQRIVPMINDRMTDSSDDILERLQMMAEVVMEIYINNPVYYGFFMTVLDGGAAHLRDELLRRNAAIMAGLDFYGGADTSRFRADPESTFLLIKWLFAGIKQEIFEIQAARDDPREFKEELARRVGSVLEALRHGIFRDELT